MPIQIPRDAVLAVLTLGLLFVLVDVLAGGKTIDRTYSDADCSIAYSRAKTRTDSVAIDGHLYASGRNRSFCISVRIASR